MRGETAFSDQRPQGLVNVGAALVLGPPDVSHHEAISLGVDHVRHESGGWATRRGHGLAYPSVELVELVLCRRRDAQKEENGHGVESAAQRFEAP